MKTPIKTPEQTNFRKNPEPVLPDSCKLCADLGYYAEEGYSKCKINGEVMAWGTLHLHVCDCFKVRPPEPTPRQKAMAKLTAADKRALGL